MDQVAFLPVGQREGECANLNFNQCVLCQRKKKECLSSGDKGRTELLSSANKNPSDHRSVRLLSISASDFSEIRYHAISCYGTFVKACKRSSETQNNTDCETTERQVPSPSSSPAVIEPRKSKRLKVSEPVCVICGKNRLWVRSSKTIEHTLYRISEKPRAQKILNAGALFQDDVFARLSTYHEIGPEAVFAADVLYHATCLRNYLSIYDRKIESIIDNLAKEDDDETLETKNAFISVISELEIESKGYSISYVRDKINGKLGDSLVSNRLVKNRIIEHYGNKICFTYPSNKRICQMFYSVNVN